MTSKLYDTLKFTALVVLPLVGTLYFGLGQLWHFPMIEEVMGSIAVLDTALGMLIGKISKDNVVGSIVVTQDSDGVPSGMRIVAEKDPLIMNDQGTITLKVKRETAL